MMNLYLIQIFSNIITQETKTEISNVYLLIGNAVLRCLQIRRDIPKITLVIPPYIEQRPEIGIEYGEFEGLVPHGVFVIKTACKPDLMKQALVGFEYYVEDGSFFRILDIDLYALEIGIEKKISSKDTKQTKSLNELISSVDTTNCIEVEQYKKFLYLHFRKKHTVVSRKNKWMIRKKDYEIIESCFGDEWIAIQEAERIYSGTNLVRKCVVEKSMSRCFIYIKEYLDCAVGGLKAKLPYPPKQRVNRTLLGRHALEYALRNTDKLKPVDIIAHGDCWIIEKDVTMPNHFATVFDKYPNEKIIPEIYKLHHTTYCKQQEYLPQENKENIQLFAHQLLHYRLDLIKKDSHFCPQKNIDIQVIHRTIQESMDRLKNGFGSLCHGDLKPDNILYTNRQFFLTDMENVCWHDPSFEIGFYSGHFINLEEPVHNNTFSKALDFINEYWDCWKDREPADETILDAKERSIIYMYMTYYYLLAKKKGGY